MEEMKFEDAIDKLEEIAKELEKRRTWFRWECSQIWGRNEIIKNMYQTIKWSRKENQYTNR